MDFLLSNPASSNLHASNYLETLFRFEEMLESIDNVLDVGCGNGHDSYQWANASIFDDDDNELGNCKVIEFPSAVCCNLLKFQQEK